MRTVHLQMNDNYKGTASAVPFSIDASMFIYLCLFIYLSIYVYLSIYLSIYVCIYLYLCIYYVKSVSLNTQEGYKVWYN